MIHITNPFKLMLISLFFTVLGFSQSINPVLTADLTFIQQPGETINYTVMVDNTATGNPNYTDLAFSGNQFVPALTLQSGDVNTNNILDQGEIWVYTTSYYIGHLVFENNGIPVGSDNLEYQITLILQEENGVAQNFQLSWIAPINNVDTDGDGVIDVFEIEDNTDLNNGCEFNADNITVIQSENWFNGDCDGDGVTNEEEFYINNATHDTDSDGFLNINDVDDDNDGIRTFLEYNNALDTDGDNAPDYLDLNADNDNILDIIEAQSTANYMDLSGADVNENGLDDAFENFTFLEDTDGDNTPDYLDLDSDNDGILDIQEGTADDDGDGVPNYRDASSCTPPIGNVQNFEICNGDDIIINLDDFTSGTDNTYSWVATDNPNVSGETLTISTNETINDILNGSGLVVYTITPTSVTGCVGEPFNLQVFVNDIIEAPYGYSLAYVCEYATLADIEVYNTINFENIYWFSTDYADQQYFLPISTPLVNGATYYAFQGNGVCAEPLAITVSVEPLVPAPLGEESQTFCDDVITLNDVIVNNTNGFDTIYWFSTPNQETGTALDSNTLVTNGATYYAFQTIGGTCIESLDVEVYLAPTTPFTDYAITSNTDEILNISLNDLVQVEGLSFNWIATDNPNVTGETMTTVQSNYITDTLVNNSNVAQDVVYTVTPIPNCSGDTFTVTVTVAPACNTPTNVYVDDIQTNSATLIWYGNPNLTYEVVLDGNPITVNYNSYTFTNLDVNTTYTYQIRTVCDANAEVYSEWEIGTFTTLSTCLPITNLTEDSVTDTTATISWTDVNGATSWEVETVLNGTTPTGNGIIVQDNPLLITNLTPSTVYNVYVRSNCGNGDFSAWQMLTFDTLQAVVEDFPYQVNVIPFQNYQQPLADTVNLDDGYTSVLDLGFNFNYFGNDYNQMALGTNSVISFDLNDAGAYCPWSIYSSNLLPSANVIDNAVLGAYQDFDNRGGASGTQGFGVIGTAPFRKFILFFDQVAMYSCTDIRNTNQTILYETYNFIDVQVKDRDVCTTWNNGNAIIGIQNIGGTEAYYPPNRNTGNWEAHNEGYRFAPAYNIPDFQFIICDANLDNVEVFDLNTIYNHFGATNSYTAFESLEDAQADTNQIQTTSYTNTSNSQTIFVRELTPNGDVNIKRVLLAVIDCNADYDLDTVATGDEDLNGNGNYGDDDTDGDQIPDFIDEDDDGDFVLTNVEAVVTTMNRGNQDATNYLDTDGDQIPNYLDNDDDGDGVLTLTEDYDGDYNPANDDTNNDGIPDYLEQSVALGVTDNQISGFKVYPNPVRNSLNIAFDEVSSNVNIKIYSIQGQEVYSKQHIESGLSIDVSNLASGIYLVNISNDNKTSIKKFVKE